MRSRKTPHQVENLVKHDSGWDWNVTQSRWIFSKGEWEITQIPYHYSFKSGLWMLGIHLPKSVLEIPQDASHEDVLHLLSS